MSLVHEIDYGTPKSKAQKTVTLIIDGASVTVPEGHVDHARGDGDGNADSETLRHRYG